MREVCFKVHFIIINIIYINIIINTLQSSTHHDHRNVNMYQGYSGNTKMIKAFFTFLYINN